jgi:arsenate reductase
MSTVIYHNPRCSKSRQTLALLQENGIEPEIVEYLQSPPDAKTLSSILQQLGISARELIRTGEDDYKAAGDKLADLSDSQLVAWMIEHPKVIQRPVVITDKGARIGRPPESVLEIIK